MRQDPRQGTIDIMDSRYLLVRGRALSVDFVDIFTSMYQTDDGREFAIQVLFDLAFSIGQSDCRLFCQKMQLEDDGIARLSAGPVSFAFAGWAQVNIYPESTPSPDENYVLVYDHPYSFEAHSWMRYVRW